MSNSPLATYVNLSPNRNHPRNNTIQVITPHHQAGNLTAEQIAAIMNNPARKMSATYAIQSNGRISRHLDEGSRPWTSGSPSNDHKAITIEVANDGGSPDWHVSDAALNALLELSVDICRRNGLKKVVYNNTSSGSITRHNMFQATLCPGPYLQSKLPWLEAEVNRRLVEGDTMAISTHPVKLWVGPMSSGDRAQMVSLFNEKAIGFTEKDSKMYSTVAVSKGDQVGIVALAEKMSIGYGPNCEGAESGITQEQYDAALQEATNAKTAQQKAEQAKDAAEKKAKTEGQRADKAEAIIAGAKTYRVLPD